MASEWEMTMGVDLGMGIMDTYHHSASSITTAPPMSSSHHSGGASYSTAHHHHYYYGTPPPMGDAAMRSTGAAGAHEFFPTAAATDEGHHYSGAPMVGDEPSPTANSSDHQTSLLSFADEFYIPEEAAELEWLSKFVDDSYSDMPTNYSSAAHAAAMAAAAAAGNGGGGTSAGQDSCVTAAQAGRGARSKRSSRATAAAWQSSFVPRPPSQSSPSTSSSDHLPSSNRPARPNGGSRGKKSPAAAAVPAGDEVGMEGGVRRCTHCASDKTPQWRTGPLGPKTLCNACGVRFKSGRLVPEYRPAASPTFVLTQHSNSHRKVVELRRQKELILIRGGSHGHRDAAAAAAAASAAAGSAGPRPELIFRDYGVC